MDLYQLTSLGRVAHVGAGERKHVHGGQLFTKVMSENNHIALVIALNSTRSVLYSENDNKQSRPMSFAHWGAWIQI